MIIVERALSLASTGGFSAWILAFIAGVATSIGPCAVPRYLAVSAILGTTTGTRITRFLLFVAGTLSVYGLIAAGGSLLGYLARASSLVYWLIALTLVSSGIRTLAYKEDHSCVARPSKASSFGEAFLLGGATSLAISPCCTPVLVAFGTLTSTNGGASTLIPLVTAYTLGHLVPLAVVCGVSKVMNPLVAAYGDASASVTAGVTIALGLYYAVLA